MPFFTIAGPKLTYVGKVPKIIFEKLAQKMINFEDFLVGKVPKRSFFNWKCLENIIMEKIGQLKKSCFHGL